MFCELPDISTFSFMNEYLCNIIYYVKYYNFSNFLLNLNDIIVSIIFDLLKE